MRFVLQGVLKYVKIIIAQTKIRELNYIVKNKELHLMSKPSATPKRDTSKFIKPDIPEQISTVTDADVPSLPKREGGPVPPPKYTLEQLLANIPEPDLKTLKSNSS